MVYKAPLERQEVSCYTSGLPPNPKRSEHASTGLRLLITLLSPLCLSLAFTLCCTSCTGLRLVGSDCDADNGAECQENDGNDVRWGVEQGERIEDQRL